MDLKKLAPLQAELDKYILDKHGITRDVSNELIIAFKVEFGEFLNEVRFFKFWSLNQEPREHRLEEFIDGIHFLLSIGNARKYVKWSHALEAAASENKSMESLSLDIFNNPMNSAGKWLQCIEDYLYLGELVGISGEMIEEAYMAKHRVNYQRQQQGY